MNIKDLAQIENQALEEARKEFPEYVEHAEFGIGLLSSFAKVNFPEGFIFTLFLNQITKHTNLSLLSALRRHHVQATLDLRFAMEAGCWAGFAIAHYDQKSFAEFGKANFVDPTPKLKGEMYKWIEKNYKPGNDSLKRFKDQLNALSTHANIVDCWRNFDQETFKHDFFDNFEDHHIKTDIWAVANLCRGVIDIFYGINLDYKILTMAPDFKENFKKLELDNDRFKTEMLKDPRLSKI
ncbi:MAG: hypothetical protein WC011_00890 [Candidatus Paceibacterota bacterium]